MSSSLSIAECKLSAVFFVIGKHADRGMSGQLPLSFAIIRFYTRCSVPTLLTRLRCSTPSPLSWSICGKAEQTTVPFRQHNYHATILFCLFLKSFVGTDYNSNQREPSSPFWNTISPQALGKALNLIISSVSIANWSKFKLPARDFSAASPDLPTVTQTERFVEIAETFCSVPSSSAVV